MLKEVENFYAEISMIIDNNVSENNNSSAVYMEDLDNESEYAPSPLGMLCLKFVLWIFNVDCVNFNLYYVLYLHGL